MARRRVNAVRLFIVLLALLLSAPSPAGAATLLAQTDAGAAIDDAQRDLIRDFYRGQAAKQAESKKAEEAKKKGKTADKKDKKKGSKAEKKKSPEKPKKLKKPKGAKAKTKGKGKDKTKGKETVAVKPAAQRIEPGSVLPPSLPRRALPRGLDSKLPKPPSGQQRVVVGDDIVLFEKKSGRVLDVVPGALKGGR